MLLPLSSEYNSIDNVISGLSALEKALRAARDRRSVYLTACVVMTREIRRRMRQRLFGDSVWVTRYVVSFANLYRKYLADFELDNLEAVPKPWLISFATSKNGKGLLTQDLLLSVNAYINHDLAWALDGALIDPHRATRYQDYVVINQALSAVTSLLKERIESLYLPGLRLLGKALSPRTDEIASFSVEKASENAWESAVALANAHNERERATVLRCVEDRSAVLARLLALPTIEHPVLIPILRSLEANIPWWEHLSPYRRYRGKTLGARLR